MENRGTYRREVTLEVPGVSWVVVGAPEQPAAVIYDNSR